MRWPRKGRPSGRIRILAIVQTWRGIWEMQPAAARSMVVSVCVAAERLARCWQILRACGERGAVALLGALCPAIAQTLMQSPRMHLVGLGLFSPCQIKHFLCNNCHQTMKVRIEMQESASLS